MMKRTYLYLLFGAAALLLTGCDSSSGNSQPGGATAAPSQSQQLETGRFAFQKVFAPARFWAADAAPIRVISSPGKNSLGHDGKSGLWQATFASPARQKAETFSWSGLVGRDAPPRGVDHGSEDSFNPANRSTQPFDPAFLKIDSDQAFNVAQQHGGKQLLEKNPGQQVLYLLDWDPSANQLRWHVLYGGSPSSSQLTVIVDASTGQFVHKE